MSAQRFIAVSRKLFPVISGRSAFSWIRQSLQGVAMIFANVVAVFQLEQPITYNTASTHIKYGAAPSCSVGASRILLQQEAGNPSFSNISRLQSDAVIQLGKNAVTELSAATRADLVSVMMSVPWSTGHGEAILAQPLRARLGETRILVQQLAGKPPFSNIPRL